MPLSLRRRHLFPYKKKRLIFLAASDDFKSMMQTIKYSRLASTTQQINSKSLVHLSHLKQQITKLSQKKWMSLTYLYRKVNIIPNDKYFDSMIRWIIIQISLEHEKYELKLKIWAIHDASSNYILLCIRLYRYSNFLMHKGIR